MQEGATPRKGRSAAGFRDLDRTIHEGARLSIMASLSTSAEMSFRELRDTLDFTDGNLGAHLKTLEAAGLIKTRKQTENGRTISNVSLSAKGRRAFEEYLGALEQIIDPARKAGAARRRRAGLAPG